MQEVKQEVIDTLEKISGKKPIESNGFLKTNVQQLDHFALDLIDNIRSLCTNTVLIKRSGTGLSITVKLE